MAEALLIRWHPAGPWTAAAEGPSLLASDTVFGAFSAAMARLGWLEEWLQAGVRVGSLFPFLPQTLLAPPPAGWWPPPGLQRFRGDELVRFVPVAAIAELARGGSLTESRWVLDPASGCLLPADRGAAGGPLRPLTRQRAAIDRLTGAAAPGVPRRGVQFAERCGLWGAVRTPDAGWTARVRAAAALLGDEGIGGGRSGGWGRSAAVECTAGELNTLVLGAAAGDGSRGWWLLSLFAPGPEDAVDWAGGAYRLVRREGHVEGTGLAKQPQRLVAEGSVLAAATEPVGALTEVTPAGAPHPVWRSGRAVAVAL